MTRERAKDTGLLAVVAALCTVPLLSCTGGASVPTDSSSAPLSTGKGLTGQYFRGMAFEQLVLTRIDSTVNFVWGYNPPAPEVPSDQFSVRWSGQVEAVYSETYTFYTLSNDGIRLWVNGQLLIDNWTVHSDVENTGTIALVAGRRYDLKIEYYDNAGGADAVLSWSSPRTPKQVVPQTQLYTSVVVGNGTGLSAQYYNGVSFDTAALTRIDAIVNFAWGSGSPGNGINNDLFSVRWTGQVQPLYSETYTFHTQSDDGIRLWVNGQQVVNNWTDHGSTENAGTIALTAGQKYSIKLEYYERTGGAVARLSWSSGSQVKQIVPSSQLYPTTVSTADAGAGDSGSNAPDARPDTTMADARSDATVADTRPDPTAADTRRDTTVADTRPDAAVLDTRPDTAAADTRPDTAVADTRPDATLADTGPDSVVTGKCNSTPTLRLVGNKILDTSGTAIVARGPEIIMASGSGAQDLDTAAATGANAARLLLGLDAANGMTPASFDTLLGRAVSHNMILWLSLYTWNTSADNVIGSSLGGGNFYSLTAPSGTGTCSKSTPAPCFLAVWTRQWLKDLVTKYQGHVIIDAGQEYIGVSDASTETGRTEWANAAMVNIRWFRSAGYTVPLQIMSNYQGRDLYAIVQKGAAIRAADSLVVGGYPQTMFGWQAYWASSWYKAWQGGLLLGGTNTITAAQAIHQFVAAQTFPIEVGLDNISGDTSSEYRAEMDQAATDKIGWLWWSWKGTSVECPVDGAACQTAVMTSQNGFAGAVRSTCGL